MQSVLKRLTIATWRTLVPKNARNSLRLWLTLEMPDCAPRLIDDFSQGPVLVLAPHMDDEIIGPGGTIARHVQQKSAVTFAFMTDGSAGDPSQQSSDLAQTRKKESRQAAQIVGVQDLVFLDGPDGALADTPQMVAALEQVFSRLKPAMVYAPALTDHHRDHWATNRILRKTFDRLGSEARRGLLIRGYEVWTPLPANRLADITSVHEIKKKAIDQFISQTRLVDYSRAILGLNQYRSMMHLNGQGFAEAFLESTVEEYQRLFDQISLKSPWDATR
jgi:LmbE family N-acetylglucosaminyl deacetylase